MCSLDDYLGKGARHQQMMGEAQQETGVVMPSTSDAWMVNVALLCVGTFSGGGFAAASFVTRVGLCALPVACFLAILPFPPTPDSSLTGRSDAFPLLERRVETDSIVQSSKWR